MNYIKTSDILIRDRNKLYLQINYHLYEMIQVTDAKISINGTYYNSSYFNLDYAIFNLSFLNDNQVYNCYIKIECIADSTSRNVLTEAGYNVISEDDTNYIILEYSDINSYNVLTEDEYNAISENGYNGDILENTSNVLLTKDYPLYLFISQSFTITTKFIVKKPSIIKIYEHNETDFDHNGLGVLTPTSAIITRTLNNMEYYLDLTHPFDEYGRWKRLREDRVIKANNQLFRIKNVSKTLSDITV